MPKVIEERRRELHGVAPEEPLGRLVDACRSHGSGAVYHAAGAGEAAVVTLEPRRRRFFSYTLQYRMRRSVRAGSSTLLMSTRTPPSRIIDWMPG